MKQLYIYLGCVAVLLTSCKIDQPLTYEGETNIYFNASLPGSKLAFKDSLAMVFAYYPNVTDTIVKIPVAFTGQATPADRDYVLIRAEGGTAVEGKHYRLPSHFSIKANAWTDTIQLELMRPADLFDTSVEMTLLLQPNGNFTTNMPTCTNAGRVYKLTKLKVLISEKLERPYYWMDNYFGTYSTKKYLLICQVNDVPLTILNEGSSISASDTKIYAVKTQRYIDEQAAQGTIIMDGDVPMAMGPEAQ